MVPISATCAGSSRAAAVAPSRRSPALRLSVAATAVVAVVLQLLQACSFTAHNDPFEGPDTLYGALNSAPYVEDATVSADRWRVIDAPKLKVDHGYVCASAKRAASREYLGSRAQSSVTLPPGFDGTVLLNGWDLEYVNGDHRLLGMGAVIFNIARNGDQLSWDAGGVLSDRRGDDEYGWCYNYTVLAWAKDTTRPGGLPKAHIDMHATHADATGKLVFADKTIGGGRGIRTKSASFKANADPRARLLAGFGVSFKDDDHLLLQFGLDLGQANIKRKKIKWSTDVILKDNSTQTYGVGELATVLTGESVHVWKPELILLEEGIPGAPGYIENDLQLTPADATTVCGVRGVTSHTYTFKIEGVPFSWAMPMLTGWDVGLYCGDEGVNKVGVSIEDFDWVRNPGDSAGTLYYTVRTILDATNPNRDIFDGMQVEVLGINMIEPPGAEG